MEAYENRAQEEEAVVERETSEGVAGVGKRTAATVVDGLLFVPVFVAMTVLFGTYAVGGGRVEFELNGYPFLLFLLAYFLYYGLFEALWGQTVGKMIFGIKVVRKDTGEVPGVGAVVARTLLRFVDSIFFYLVAFVAVLVSPNRQRLGDMAAGTLVVRKEVAVGRGG